MNKYYFTFGSGHHDTRGRSLMGWYKIIEAENENAARTIYVEKYGSKWSGTYTDPEFQKQIELYGLQYEVFEYLDLCCQIPQNEYLAMKAELERLRQQNG